jgi:hypothetical protein
VYTIRGHLSISYPVEEHRDTDIPVITVRDPLAFKYRSREFMHIGDGKGGFHS